MGSKIKIVVLHRGWVAVGIYERDGVDVTVTGRVVRRWGTSRGLAELASKGPLEDTRLEDIGVMRHHVLSEITVFDCNDERWREALEMAS